MKGSICVVSNVKITNPVFVWRLLQKIMTQFMGDFYICLKAKIDTLDIKHEF